MSNEDTHKPIFRIKPSTLTVGEVESMIKKWGFYDQFLNSEGEGFNNSFEARQIRGDKIVIDFACSLMWQRGGSTEAIKHEDAKEWLEKLNKNGFAGFHDWRLPTLEEAMSLMKPKKKSGDLYIDPVFNKNQLWIWTVDMVKSEQWAWVVLFSAGYCSGSRLGYYDPFVRAVRFGQSSLPR